MADHDTLWKWHLFVLTVIIFCAALEFLILCILSYRFYTHQRRNQPSNNNEKRFEFSRRWTIVFIVLCILTAASDFVHIYLGNIRGDQSVYSDRYRFIIATADIFYFIYTIMLYIFLIYRVYAIFQPTEHPLSKCTMLLFLVLFTVICGLMCYYLVVLVIEKKSINIHGFEYPGNPVLWIPIICVDILINFGIMMVMIYKLRHTVIDRVLRATESVGEFHHSDAGSERVCPLVVSDEREQSPRATDRNSRVDAHSQIYVDIMSKFSVLSTIIILSNQIFGIWVLYAIHLNTNVSKAYVNVIQNVGYGMRDVEGLIDCVVVYLTFKMNANVYDKWCCCCHSVLKNLYMTNINKEIERKISSRVREQQD